MRQLARLSQAQGLRDRRINIQKEQRDPPKRQNIQKHVNRGAAVTAEMEDVIAAWAAGKSNSSEER
jgi:hypothetical protein